MVNAIALNHVIQQTVQAVEDSKEQIFDIAEQARQECENLQQEIEQLKNDVIQTINKGDDLEIRLVSAKKRLAEVSRKFTESNEPRIRAAYDVANELQNDLFRCRESEKFLRRRRDELQLRLKQLGKTVEKAENLMTQMSVITDYLSGDLQEASVLVEEARIQKHFGVEIIQVQEEERRRVAREIHDGPAQHIANLAVHTEIIERLCDQDGVQKVKEELRAFKGMIRESLAEVRRIIFNLRPMALDDLGLIPTLTKYIDDLNLSHSLNIQFRKIGEESSRLPSPIEVSLFRFVQEALTNVTKHAGANEALVKIEFQPEQVYLVVEDDGSGFEPEEHRSGFGLLGMKERVKLLNGVVQIQSKIGQGSKIIFKVPRPV